MTLKEFKDLTKDMPENAILLNYIDGEIEQIEYDSESNEIIIW